ncbi:putative MFS family arabinose efflux permease [Bosea sp. OAE752]|uniref:MFS transporter n=1 Tax=unclassified Bosea (in: a-proteobacteria) TaxID=2653178 RepID=UPI00114F1328
MNETTSDAPTIGAGLTIVLAAACGLIVANLYYAQPLAGPIGATLGMSAELTGLIVTLTQIGYGLGLVFLVPLGDLVENRLLIVTLVALAAVSLGMAALAASAAVFLAASLLIGMTCVAAQVLVPLAAHMAPEQIRGRVVGNVVSGLLFGIMLARPVASLVADAASWHAVFVLSAVAMLALAAFLWFRLPQRRPHTRLGYGELIASMGALVMSTPVLRRRAGYQACMFAAFSLFWTVTPLYLTGPQFGLTQRGVALFALAGVAGTIASPIAGRLADAGWTRPATAFALILAAGSFALTFLAEPGSTVALALLTIAAILLDYGVTTGLVLGQRAIFALGQEQRSRLNGLFIASFFMGGALGSALGGWAFAHGGWPLAGALGAAMPLLALAYFATEFRARD